jgi:secreted trypsin-like serine protease
MRLLGSMLFLALLYMRSEAAEPTIALSVESSNTVSAQASGAPPMFRTGPGKISARVDGKEDSECRPYGRKSVGDALADVEVLAQGQDSLSLRMSSSAAAIGGHYRSCAGCISGNCVGITGNDTTGKSSAVAYARVAIKFDKRSPPADYLVSLAASSQSVTPKMLLTDERGKEIPIRNSNGKPATILGGHGATYFVTLELPVVASNEGSCCEATNFASARVDLEVLKAPIFSSASKLVPFIVGGKQSSTMAYPSVGALMLDGNMHCTGTLVDKATVLTAAHCLSGYEKQVPTMTFVFGSNAFQPTSGPFKVTGIAYPDGKLPGFSFNPNTLEDDIGLVYISPEPTVSRYALHKGQPAWMDINGNQTQLLFVGFGYNEIEGQQIGLGIKREVPLPISLVENRRVAFRVKGKATCHGDSGGPAFLEESGTLFQTSVTSGADEDSCTQGIQYQTRVDAFLPWLTGKLR